MRICWFVDDFLIGYSGGEPDIHLKLVGRVSPIQRLRLLFNWGELCRWPRVLTPETFYCPFSCKNSRREVGLLGIPDFCHKSAEKHYFEGEGYRQLKIAPVFDGWQEYGALLKSPSTDFPNNVLQSSRLENLVIISMMKNSDWWMVIIGHYIPQLAALIVEHNKKTNIKPIKLKSIAVNLWIIHSVV